MSWTELFRNHPTVTMCLAAGFGVLVVAALAQAVYHASHYGLRPYLRNLLRIDSSNWRIIAVLLLVALAMLIIWLQHN